MRHAGVLHDGGHVGEVQIDKAGVADQVGDGLHRLAQHVVRDLKGVGKGDLLVGGVFQPLVGDDDKGIHLAPQVFDALLRLRHALASLKAEGLCHHAHGEDALLSGSLRHHRSSAGAGAAAHAGGDEHHVGVLQRLGQLVAALLGGLAPHLGVGACALAAGELLADLDLIACRRRIQRLLICVHGHKIDALDAVFDHAIDYIIAAAAYADDLDADDVFHSRIHCKCHVLSSCCRLCEMAVLSSV